MLKVTTSSSDKDAGRKLLLRVLGQVDGAHADVGIFDGGQKHEGSELTVAQIGAVHELGSKKAGIPERSWLRSNHDKNISKYNARLDREYERIIAGRARVVSSLLAFAEHVASDVRENIIALREPPLAQATINRKGSSNPLIDNNIMLNSVQGRVLLHGAKAG